MSTRVAPGRFFASLKASAVTKSKKTRKDAVAPTLQTAAEQHVANLARGEEQRELQRERMARQSLKTRTLAAAKEADEAKRKRAAEIVQDAVLCDEASVDLVESAASAETPLTAPSKRRIKRPARCDDGLEGPIYESRLTLRILNAVCTSKLPSVSYKQLRTTVGNQLETSVFYCTDPARGVQTLNELASHEGFPNPEDDGDAFAQWAAWFSPKKWKTLVDLCRDGNQAAFRSITNAGNYNAVLAPTDQSPTDDPLRWPVLLSLAKQPLAFRMTRSDPFPHSSANEPHYRCVSRTSMTREMAMTLYAAAAGFGTPVHAAVSWPWDSEPNRFGLLLVLERCTCDFAKYQDALWDHACQTYNSTPRPSGTAPPEFDRVAERVATALVEKIFKLSRSHFLNFDLKPGNILVAWDDDEIETPTLFLSDFDSTYTRVVDPDVAGLEACFFVNLLLLAMHVRAYSKPAFVKAFMRVVGPLLLQSFSSIDTECKKGGTSFGAGAEWVFHTPIAFDEKNGAFDHLYLKVITHEADRLSAQLKMMVFEYLFDASDGKRPPRRAVDWPGWKKTTDGGFFGSAPLRLVPQVLRFAVFYNDPLPVEWAALLTLSA